MTKMKPDDPAYWMLFDGVVSTPTVYAPHCYICNDPEYAQMGLPLCYECLVCGGHVAADEHICINGHEQPQDPEHELEIRKEHGMEIPSWLLEQCAQTGEAQ